MSDLRLQNRILFNHRIDDFYVTIRYSFSIEPSARVIAFVTKPTDDISISMEEIDRCIDEMPTINLRDPKNRKQTSVNIEEIVESLDLDAAMEKAMEEYRANPPSTDETNNEKANQPDMREPDTDL